ncbi:hypothetical protein HOH87_02270 [bacterium]|jgi:fatty acid-binding protein DegV|nr:hypothetical protein [bacterium]
MHDSSGANRPIDMASNAFRSQQIGTLSDGAKTTNTQEGSQIRSAERAELVHLQETESPNPKELMNFLNKTHYKDFRHEAISLVLSMNSSNIEGLAADLMMIIRSEMGSDAPDMGVNVHYVAMMIETLAEALKGADPILKGDLNQLIRDLRRDQPDNQLIQWSVTQAQSIMEGGIADANEFMSEGAMTSAPVDGSLNIAQAQVPVVNPGIVTQGSFTQVAAENGFTEQDLGTHNVFESQDKSIKVDLQGVSADVSALLPNAWAHGVGNTRHGIGPTIVSLGNLPPVIVIPEIMSYLLVKLSRVRNKRNIYKFAIVTDSVASVVRIEKHQNIRYIDITKDISEDTLMTLYQELIDEGFTRIISMHLNPKLNRSYMFAKGAAERTKEASPDTHIHVVNTHANGVGLGLIINEVNKAIADHYAPSEILHLIHDCVETLHYWVIPTKFNYNRNQAWVSRIVDSKEKMKLRVMGYVPVIALKNTLRIEGCYKDEEEAINLMIHHVDSEISKRRRKVRGIGIEYRGVYRRAITLSNTLKVKYKNIPVSTHVSGSITASYFGPELIGVCFI